MMAHKIGWVRWRRHPNFVLMVKYRVRRSIAVTFAKLFILRLGIVSGFSRHFVANIQQCLFVSNFNSCYWTWKQFGACLLVSTLSCGLFCFSVLPSFPIPLLHNLASSGITLIQFEYKTRDIYLPKCLACSLGGVLYICHEEGRETSLWCCLYKWNDDSRSILSFTFFLSRLLAVFMLFTRCVQYNHLQWEDRCSILKDLVCLIHYPVPPNIDVVNSLFP